MDNNGNRKGKQYPTAAQIATAWDSVEGRTEKKQYAYQAAAEIGLSEAAFLATKTGYGVTRLNNDLDQLLAAFEQLGVVKVITRNLQAVHEVNTTFSKAVINGGYATIDNQYFSLRIALNDCAFVFAQNGERGGKALLNFQIFDTQGSSVCKIFVSEDIERAQQIVAACAHKSQDSIIHARVSPHPERSDAHILNSNQLVKDWLAMNDWQESDVILQKHKVSKVLAYRVLNQSRLPGNNCVHLLDASSLRSILESAAQLGIALQVRVANAGSTQSYHGLVKKIMDHGPWINVLDKTFHLHVKEGEISESYLLVQTLAGQQSRAHFECFNQYGQTIISIAGLGQSSDGSLEQWSTLVQALKDVNTQHEHTENNNSGKVTASMKAGI